MCCMCANNRVNSIMQSCLGSYGCKSCIGLYVVRGCSEWITAGEGKRKELLTCSGSCPKLVSVVSLVVTPLCSQLLLYLSCCSHSWFHVCLGTLLVHTLVRSSNAQLWVTSCFRYSQYHSTYVHVRVCIH